jgi:alpha-N-arabinofuranosidase
MRRCALLSFFFLPSFLVRSQAQITVSRPMPATVTVTVGGEGTDRVPPTLFGAFLEPIGDSINHGINAEILVNGSLESGLWNHTNLEKMFFDQPELIESSDTAGIPLPWEPLNMTAGNRFELHVGDAANSWQSLEILGLPNQDVGIKQKVYVPAQRELNYRVSFYARHLSGPSGITVEFRATDTGNVLAHSRVNVPATSWTKYSTNLRLISGTVRRLEPVDFAIAVSGVERADVDEISVMPDDAIGILDPDVVSMAKGMGAAELRFGGNFSSSYHWRDGVGFADKRPVLENTAWGIPEYNQFGTDEFLQLCRLIGVIPQFDLNMGSGTPQEAADWVRYIRNHYQGPVIYELGNELYGKWQVGYKTLADLAPSTLEFSQAVRAIAPDATIIATGMGPLSDGKWNAAQLSNPPATFNDLSLHFILGTNHPALQGPTPDFTAAAAYALPYAAGPYFDEMQEQVDAHPGLKGHVHFAVTEWLFNSKGYGERNFTDESPSWINEGGAVMAAGFLNTLLRHTWDVNIADMTGLMEFAGIWKKREQVYAVPAFYVFRMYSSVKGDTVLPVSSDSGSYDVSGGVRPLVQMRDIPYIDVVATRSADGRIVTLLCVNRNLQFDTPTTFNLGSLSIVGPVAGEQIRAASRYEGNDEIEPKHIVPEPITISHHSSNSFTLVLPHESVTVLKVRL